MYVFIQKLIVSPTQIYLDTLVAAPLVVDSLMIRYSMVDQVNSIFAAKNSLARRAGGAIVPW